MADTTDRGYPYPEEDDVIAVHTDVQALAEAVDADVQAVADDADGHFVLDADNTATGSNTFGGETTFNDNVTINKGSGLHLFKGGGIFSDGYFDYRGQIKDGPNLVNKQYVDDADKALSDRLDEVESQQHRGDFTWTTTAPPAPGEIYARNAGASWATLINWQISKFDQAGVEHPFELVEAGWLLMIERVNNGHVVGSAYYDLVSADDSHPEHLAFEADIIKFSGDPPANGDTMRLLFAPPGSSTTDFDAYSKSESDAKFLAKGTSTNLQLANGTTKAQSSFAASNHTHSDYASSSHTHSGYASSSHTHSYWTKVDATRTASGISKLGQLPTGTSTNPSLDVGQMYLNTNTGNITIRVS